MSAYKPAFDLAGYPTNIYGLPVDQYVPCHWTPDPNQAFYTPSISQGVPLGWHYPPTFPADGVYSHMYPGGFPGAPPAMPNSAYLPPVHYYAYPIPAVAPAPPEQPDNYPPSQLQFPAQILSFLRQQ
ncbi:hypothetical protein C0989_008636 [Termitomyces sp. Mn162]|nr:hypothetical protein C0989_008636 [Termitomyces sp. Mn162]